MESASGRPHVVIVGGYLTLPLFYWPMRERLLERGAARVTIAQLYWPDWLAASFAGFGPSMLRTARAVRRARRNSRSPLIVVGHSAGGILGRLAMSPLAFDGRIAAVADDIGCLVTLGTPHRLLPTIPFWKDHPGRRATLFLERETPGAYFAPTTAYVTVGSSLVPPADKAPTNAFKHIVNRVMREFVGETGDQYGDGIVGNDLSQLQDVPHVELPDVLHGTFGGPWYGDSAVIDRWWPVAQEAWQSALIARRVSA